MPRGGVLGKRKVASLSSASGIWNLDDVAIERKGFKNGSSLLQILQVRSEGVSRG